MAGTDSLIDKAFSHTAFWKSQVAARMDGAARKDGTNVASTQSEHVVLIPRRRFFLLYKSGISH